MPSSHQKAPVYHIAIHRAGPDVSMDEFKTNMRVLADKWLNLPQSKKFARSCDLIFMNNMMDGYVKVAGLPDSRPIFIGKGEYENAESITEVSVHQIMNSTVKPSDYLLQLNKLPETVKYFKHPEYHADRDVTTFVASADIKFERQSNLASANRAHCLAVLEVPEGRSAEECERRLDLLLDRFLKRPVVQKNVLKLTLLRQDSSMNHSLHEVGIFRFTKHTLIIHGEYANQQDLMETMNVTEASLQELIVEALKDFNTSRTTGFGADVITILEKN
ncbi:hypothetical protein FB45DRAFT_1041356 [Roridomyces roridus]|uniref:Uncharacterized protein n=1 Tax=Roridomyces roridus TaxID=1738132 RepID=A0AAD7B0K8_9AGAR|nr:hypothetical protein FB45DRAFT_1041356 [Roridomyces roridus]